MNNINEQDKMQKYHDTFIASLILLLDLIKSYDVPVSKNANIMLNSIDDIDIDKMGSIIRKVYIVCSSNIKLLCDNDRNLFKLQENRNNRTVLITVIPAIDLNDVYDLMPEESQKELWNYLKSLYLSSVYMIDSVHNLDLTNIGSNIKVDGNIIDIFWKKFPDNKIIIKQEFNPFIGVGQDNAEYSVKELLSGPEVLPEDQKKSGILGLEKLLNMEDLRKQLKNIKKEDIQKATENMKKMLGDIDEGTLEIFDIVAENITDELANSKEDNIMKIAENIAKKITPKIDPKKMDINKIWNSTKQLANNCGAEGNPMFKGPLAMMANLMDSQIKQMQGVEVTKETQEEQLKKCQKMMSDLGFPQLTAEQLSKLNLDEVINKNPKN